MQQIFIRTYCPTKGSTYSRYHEKNAYVEDIDDNENITSIVSKINGLVGTCGCLWCLEIPDLLGFTRIIQLHTPSNHIMP